MARRQRTILLMLQVVVLAAAPAPAVRADSKSESDPVYRELIQLAHGAYEVGDLAEAKRQFQAAHARRPGAHSLRGLGTVELALGDFAIAAQHLTQALASNDPPLTGSVRAETQAAAHKARSQVGYAQLLVSPETAEIKLNERVVPHGAVLVLAPGVYRLALSADGYQAQARPFTVMPGQHQLVQALLERTAPQAPPTAAARALAEPPAPQPRAVAQKMVLYPQPLLLIGASAALLAVGGVLLAEGLSEHNNAAPRADAEQAGDSRRDQAIRFEASGAALLGLATIGAAAGLWWYHHRTRDERLRLSFGGDRLTLRGRF